MPRRSNWFQRLVLTIETQLSPETATVTESAMLPDRATGDEREVDILIETRVGAHDMSLAIECVGGEGRPADVTWVEKIAAKHRDLPVDRSILVSRTGFSKNAGRKAVAFRMESLSLAEALDVDWRAKLDSWPRTLKVTGARLVEAKMQLSFKSQQDEDLLAGLDTTALSELPVYAESGAALGTFSELMREVFADKRVQELEGQFPVAGQDGMWLAPIELCDVENGFIVDRVGNRIRFSTVRILGLMKKETIHVPWERRTYGDAAVAFGRFPFEENFVTMVVTETPDRGPVAQLILDEPAERELNFELELQTSEDSESEDE